MELVAGDDAAAPAWWVCRLRRNDSDVFVYGCAAPASPKTKWRKDAPLDVKGLGRLEIRQLIVPNDVIAVFRKRLAEGTLELDLLGDERGTMVSVKASRRIIQAGLGHTCANVTAYYSLPDVSQWIASDDLALGELLSLLEKELNFPFKSTYAGRIGNFEMFDLDGIPEAPRPFLIEIGSRPAIAGPNQIDRSAPETFEICRTRAFAQAKHLAHVVGRAHGDVVVNRLIFLEPGELRVSWEASEWLDQLDFQLFDETGCVPLHSEQNTYMNRIGLVLAPTMRPVTIEDDLSLRAAQRGLGRQASVVNVHSSHRSSIGAPEQGSWRKFAEDMDDLVASKLPSPGPDNWFTRDIEGELGVIAHFDRLLSGGSVHSAVLVDPWFGVSALNAFAVRLGSSDVELTILTSWTRSDPDTGRAFATDANPTDELETAIRRLERFIAPALRVINLTDGNDQAFHDRYLLLYPHEGSSKVYLLSNSLNRAARNWPFCMSLLAADTGLEVRRYIEGLRDGRDTARGRSLTTTFKWPDHAV
jgi:hypothetical protein